LFSRILYPIPLIADPLTSTGSGINDNSVAHTVVVETVVGIDGISGILIEHIALDDVLLFPSGNSNTLS
jgi:hypothetical protein